MPQLYHYGLLTISTVAFGLSFFFQNLFQEHCGNTLKATLLLNAGTGLVGFIVSLFATGFTVSVTWFALLMATLSAADCLAFSYCSLKAMEKINLSLYSLFSMLGGMALPFLSGIFLHGEPFTLSKAVCFLLISGALFLTGTAKLDRRDAWYYIGIFFFNGMSGVIAKIYQALPYDKVSPAGFSLLISLLTLVFCAAFLIRFKAEKLQMNPQAILGIAGNGVFQKTGELLLLIALTVLPASAQYPFITGGTMIVSAIISFFTNKKPSKRELLSITISFIGILMLLLLPEIVIFTI